MFRKRSFIAQTRSLLFCLRNIICFIFRAPKVLFHNEAFKEACVLSYYGLFSCVPILVFFLRLSQYLFSNLDIKSLLLSKFPDYREPILVIVEAANHSSSTSIGLVIVGSFFVFCWAIILMLLSLEDSLNKIFKTGWTPASLQRIVAYLLISLVSPMVFIILCGVWIYITRVMPLKYAKLFSTDYTLSGVYFLSKLMTYALLYIILFCCYAFLPRASVQKRAAIIATLIAGTVWILLQKAFFCLQMRLFNYSFTYGALVALPSFLFLLYLYSMIYLFGGALTSLIQNQGYHLIPENKPLPRAYMKAVLCTYILTVILERFNNKQALTIKYLAKCSKIPTIEITECLEILEKEGLIITYKQGFHPAYNITNLTIQEIIAKLIHLDSSAHHYNATISFIHDQLTHMLSEMKISPCNLTLFEILKERK